jgi:hypothetical protein
VMQLFGYSPEPQEAERFVSSLPHSTIATARA